MTLDGIWDKLEGIVENLDELIAEEKNKETKAEMESLRDYLEKLFEEEGGEDYAE